MTVPPDAAGVGKPPTQDWQRCGACGAWWPVDADFRAFGAAVPTECPRCGHVSPFDPGVVASGREPAPRTRPESEAGGSR